ncbi:hypothetical protein HGRIS_000877 [Hohenbuehelia grisea]|uniref:Uncharacterized protein n=1 Tax=Hohenbuehelia grisea TaxID=104357 RepID=A0ABR3IQ08_9AGAR
MDQITHIVISQPVGVSDIPLLHRYASLTHLSLAFPLPEDDQLLPNQKPIVFSSLQSLSITVDKKLELLLQCLICPNLRELRITQASPAIPDSGLSALDRYVAAHGIRLTKLAWVETLIGSLPGQCDFDHFFSQLGDRSHYSNLEELCISVFEIPRGILRMLEGLHMKHLRMIELYSFVDDTPHLAFARMIVRRMANSRVASSIASARDILPTLIEAGGDEAAMDGGVAYFEKVASNLVDYGVKLWWQAEVYNVTHLACYGLPCLIDATMNNGVNNVAS